MSIARRRALIGVLGIMLMAESAFGVAQVYDDGHLKLTVYAPDWIWQGQNINVLVVAEHTGQSSTRLLTHLYFPKGLEDHFEHEGKASQLISIEDGERQRIAFANITALTGHPLQDYEFEFYAYDVQMDVSFAIRLPFKVRANGERRHVGGDSSGGGGAMR